LPVILVVDDDPAERENVSRALSHRFGNDYQVKAADSADEGIRELEQLAASGSDVALIAADIRLGSESGVDLLDRAHQIHPAAIRILLLEPDSRGTRIPFGDLDELRRSTALGRIDLSIRKGWVTPEEWFYPQVQQALASWTTANRPHYEVMKIVGDQWSPGSHALRQALGRNTVPFGFYGVDTEAGRQLLDQHNVDPERLPAVILRDGSVLHSPTAVDVANALGVRTKAPSEAFDLAIAGAGPAGLAAAVYGASEGLRVLVIEPHAIGGQAGTSAMIRNYLGFPRGLSGSDLTFRAWEQALLFGAEFMFTQRAVGISQNSEGLEIHLERGDRVRSRSLVIAVGVTYRRLGIPTLDRLIGAGVFYGAAAVEAPGMTGENVVVVGGANSAGQAALHLAKYATSVHLLVRGPSLSAGMSEYLITQIESTPNVSVRLQTQVVDGRGEHRLASVILEHAITGTREEMRAAALFVLIGAHPHTDWLPEGVLRDSGGFIVTGRDIADQNWPLTRLPFPFETSMPGVFAAGDVRSGSTKRVASAVGEGSVSIRYVHEYLATATTLSAPSA
jgi:thioredoxin reductase (NADPH)